MSSTEEDIQRKEYRKAYGPKHHIPTIQQYREEKQQQREELSAEQPSDPQESANGHAGQGIGRWFAKKDDLPSRPSNTEPGATDQSEQDASSSEKQTGKQSDQSNDGDMIQKEDKPDVTQSEAVDPKARRKQMKHKEANTAEREVTDPVTHLPVTIRDFTDADLQAAEKHGEEDDGSTHGQGMDGASGKPISRRSTDRFSTSGAQQQAHHDGMEKVFPPPDFQLAREEMAGVYAKALAFGLGSIGLIFVAWVFMYLALPSNGQSPDGRRSKQEGRSYAGLITLGIGSIVLLSTAGGLIYALQGWVNNKAKQTWEDCVWEVQRQHNQAPKDFAAEPEPTKWLNQLLGSIWPLINPDLFASLVDTLEDVMQASLPTMVRMVSVEDIGQGSESLRILGIKWLPHGAAGESVDAGGDVKNKKQQHQQDISRQQDGATEDVAKDANNRSTEAQDDEQGNEQEEQGFEAEAGEFVNLEVAFAYRASQSVRKHHEREKNAHLYMAFYLPGGIKFPVWVEMRGLVGTMRMRLQLTPDPPFVALCTLTFLGQPKVDMSCMPLVKHGLNIMDIPLISNFVQSAVDAAMNEYVAPKSLTLDLKAMLAGDDFKHDTVARGVVAIKIHRAFDFKASDMEIPMIRKGSSDPYVSVAWAKFGKPQFSTRVMIENMEPYWEEETFLTVGPEELDAEELLRLQLWDSDKGTADDDLGRIEIPIKDIMRNDESNGRFWRRKDTFEALKAGETMPGRLDWSVGYFTKARLLDSQVAQKAPNGDVMTVEQLKDHSFRESSRKLREANRDESAEAEQLKEEDFENTCTEMITNSLPSSTWPSGILSVQIHQVVGLEVEKPNRSRANDGDQPDDAEDETGDDLPDAYCTIILNHQKVFKTRTKPQNSKPFFNAGTERFIRDWRTANVMISVRDSRVHEDHPLLGVVNINIAETLRSRGASRLNEFFPLAGGIGYGKVRISIVFRSVQMQPTINSLGWEWGTIEVSPKVMAPSELPHDLHHCRIKVRTQLGKGSLWHSASASKEDQDAQGGVWLSRKSRPIRVPVRRRYSAPLILEFRSSRMLLPDHSPAFCILWLQNLSDEEVTTLDLPVFRGDLKRAEANVLPEDQNGEKVGTLRVTVRFWRGLGQWHGKLAKRSPDLSNVMECLVTARDNGLLGEKGCLVGDAEWLEARGHERDDGDDNNEHGDESSDSDDDNDPGAALEGKSSDASAGQNEKTKADQQNANSSKSVSGFMNEVKEYGRHKDQLHRRHRGMMQWKGPRTIKWLKGRAEHMGDKVKEPFRHHDRHPGVETEV